MPLSLGHSLIQSGPCTDINEVAAALDDLQRALGGAATPFKTDPGSNEPPLLEPVYAFNDPNTPDGTLTLVSPPTGDIDNNGIRNIQNYSTITTVGGTLVIGRAQSAVTAGSQPIIVNNLELISGVDPRDDPNSNGETITVNNTFQLTYSFFARIMAFKHDDSDEWETVAPGPQGQQGQPGQPGATGAQGPQGPPGAPPAFTNIEVIVPGP